MIEMTKINGIHFPDEEFTLKQVQEILKQKKKKLKFTIVDTNKEA